MTDEMAARLGTSPENTAAPEPAEADSGTA
ncbi:hypothetical protein QFZ43_004676 [Streptomyces afghaniensis]|nr:hypothetical protein [Streptomyces afghaniensis]